ncbi:MAG: hypothetical protein ABMB14_15165 [Myxococcota bacterium]
MIAWLQLGAQAAEPVAGWTGSRWMVEIEETTPSLVELSAAENFSFRTRALQIQAALNCPEVHPIGKNVSEVDCKVESLAIRATPRTLSPQEATNPANAKVLADVVARLERKRIVLTVNVDGRVSSVDLPDLEASNRRESESREVLRRLMFDLVAGFDLKRPEDWKAGWIERNSPLLRAPTEPASIGLSKTHHTVSTVEGNTVVESTGSGSFTAPYIPAEFDYQGKFATQGKDAGSSVSRVPGQGSSSFSAANDGRLVGLAGPSATTPTDMTFSGTLTSVAVVRPEDGSLLERVWATLGEPTSSSIGAMQGTSLYYAGHLRRIGDTEAVQLGPTEIVAPPGQQMDGIGVWTPITTL